MKRHTERRKTDASDHTSRSGSPEDHRDFERFPQFLTGSLARRPIFELRVGLDILEPLNSSRSVLEFQDFRDTRRLNIDTCEGRLEFRRSWKRGVARNLGFKWAYPRSILRRPANSIRRETREIVRRARHGNFIESTIDFRRRERARHLENTKRKRKRTRGMRGGEGRRERKKLATCCCAAQATRAMNYTRRASSSCQRLLSSRVHPERAETK